MNIKKLSLIVVAAATLQVQPTYSAGDWFKNLVKSKSKQDASTPSRFWSVSKDLLIGGGKDQPNPNCLLKFLPTADALMKLYMYLYAGKYSELASGTVKQEAQTALANFGQTPSNYEIKIISTPCFNNIYSFKKQENGKSVIYLDKVGLAGKDQEQLRVIIKDKIEAALYRPFITYETIKALVPLLVHVSGNAVINSTWAADYTSKTDSITFKLLDSSTLQLLLSVAIISGLNYSKAYKLPTYISSKVR